MRQISAEQKSNVHVRLFVKTFGAKTMHISTCMVDHVEYPENSDAPKIWCPAIHVITNFRLNRGQCICKLAVACLDKSI